MDIMFDRCLREFLEKRGKTQRELAEFLSISTQAVSKWCRGENMPDIALLPRIAAFLDVSIDELLGVGEIRKKDRILRYQKENHDLARDGFFDECIEIWRKAYSEFPNDMSVNENLMHALFRTQDEKYHDEVLALGERILCESTDERQRSSAIQVLCFIHGARGNKEKAKEYAEMSSPIYVCKEVLLSDVLEGEESMQHNLGLMLECMNIIAGTETKLCRSADFERELWLHEFCLKLMELFFDDGFYGIYAMVAEEMHLLIAKIHLSRKNDEQKAYEHLKAAARFAKQYDGLPDSFVYTSTLLKGYKNNRAILTPYTETECEKLLDYIGNSEFDSVRSKDWFKAIVEELEAAK